MGDVLDEYPVCGRTIPVCMNVESGPDRGGPGGVGNKGVGLPVELDARVGPWGVLSGDGRVWGGSVSRFDDRLGRGRS